MKKSDFTYELPEALIAQTPCEPRDHARLLVYDRKTDLVAHKRFYDLTDYLKAGDLLVRNRTRVLPARIFGKKASGATVEFLLHKRQTYTEWETLARPAKRARVGDWFVFSPLLSAEVIATGDEGIRCLRFRFDGVFEQLLQSVGQMPLPHYIHQMPQNPERYQTVYAKEQGSSAAPTAGLHFTEALLKRIEDLGVETAEVLLHVGLGTFRPVKTEELADHKMHAEFYQLDKTAADQINRAKSEGRRVIAVGTTSVRVLESCADENGFVSAGSGETNIFIYPPYKFRAVDALLTNFHLPESTLLMLVSAFLGRENALQLYRTAVQNCYRFFSFGDACLLL